MSDGIRDAQAAWITRVLGITATAGTPDDATANRAASGLPGFTKRLTAMMPAVQAALTGALAHTQDIRVKVSEAGLFARKRHFTQAHTLLDAAEELLADDREPAPVQDEQPDVEESPLDIAQEHWG